MPGQKRLISHDSTRVGVVAFYITPPSSGLRTPPGVNRNRNRIIVSVDTDTHTHTLTHSLLTREPPVAPHRTKPPK